MLYGCVLSKWHIRWDAVWHGCLSDEEEGRAGEGPVALYQRCADCGRVRLRTQIGKNFRIHELTRIFFRLENCGRALTRILNFVRIFHKHAYVRQLCQISNSWSLQFLNAAVLLLRSHTSLTYLLSTHSPYSCIIYLSAHTALLYLFYLFINHLQQNIKNIL